MIMTSETIKLNLIPGGELPVLHASQFDDGRALSFEIYDGDEPYTSYSAYDISIHLRKVDGTIIGIDTFTIDTENDCVVFTTTEQMCACAGKNIGELVFTDTLSGVVVGSCNFILEVEPDPYAGGIDSASEIENLSTQIAAIVDGQLDNYYTKEEIDDQIETIVTEQVTPIVSGIVSEQVPPIVESEMGNYYTKSDIDDNFYDKVAVDTLLSGKADTSDLPDMNNYYDKTTTDTLLASKANTSTTYTKTEVDNLIAAIPSNDITTEITTPASVQTFNDGSDNIPMKSLVTEILPIQAGLGTPSPTNVRAISGHSSVTVFNSGKNLIFTLYQSSSNLILINGESTYATTLKKGTYTFSATISKACSFNYRKSADDTTVNIKSFTTTGNVSATFTIDEDMYNCNFFLYSSQGISVSDISNAQLELNDEVTTYEAYQGTTTTIPLGSTVYGGSLECVEGQVISEWVNIASYSGETIEEPWLCSQAPFVSGTTPPTGSQVVYKTSTPTSLSVSGANIPTLSGVNNVYTDCGDIQSLEYFNDKADDIAALISLITRS